MTKESPGSSSSGVPSAGRREMVSGGVTAAGAEYSGSAGRRKIRVRVSESIRFIFVSSFVC